MRARVVAFVLAALCVVLPLAACGGDDDDDDSGGNYTPPAGANVNPAVVSRINRMTDCNELQGQFDTAEANGNTEFMRVADARMQAVGCY